MKLIEAVKAYQAVAQLSGMSTKNWKLARDIFLMKAELEPAFQFNMQEEKKIVEQHPFLNPSNGVITIPGGTNEDARKEAKIIDAEFDALHNSDWSFPEQGKVLPLILIRPEDFSGAEFSGDMIGSLMPFVIFADEKEAESNG